jgi:small subunit ribosomal protein S1
LLINQSTHWQINKLILPLPPFKGVRVAGADMLNKLVFPVETSATKAKENQMAENQTGAHTGAALEDFDWSGLGKRQENYSNEERQKLEELYEQTLKTVDEHEVVEGRVVAKTNKEVLVDIGYKSDGIVPLSEFRYNPDLKVGDTVEVYVEKQEDKGGQLLLSHRKARSLKAWERINVALEKDEILKGFVKCRTKGGLIVDVFGIEAFLPGSQIDVKPIRDYDIYVGKTMEFKVVKINNEFKNVVVSHKALIEEELEQQKKDIISKLEKGQVLEGTVKNITSYGVFVDLGGVDGLIHITDLSWGRINHPEEVVKLDEKINVVILDFDNDKKRIALGLKQLTSHPWDALDANLSVGDKVKGKVVVIADYGAFIEIAAGVEGLIHVSEMSWSQHLRSAQDFLNVGDEVEAVILTLDREERKMSLGIKQLIPDPWAGIEEKYPAGSKHSGTVRNFTNFGVFVELEEGVDGLIHISDLSWSKKIKHPSEFTKVGEKIDVVVLELDKENRRLSLGHKQLEENPWDVFESIFTEGSIHQGTIINMSDKGAVVSLPYGVEGFAPSKHLTKADGTTAGADEIIDFKVIEFNKENKKIVVSHARIHEDAASGKKSEERAEKSAQDKSDKKAVKKVKDSMEKTTLGDINVLANLKEELEESEKKKKDKDKE